MITDTENVNRSCYCKKIKITVDYILGIPTATAEKRIYRLNFGGFVHGTFLHLECHNYACAQVQMYSERAFYRHLYSFIVYFRVVKI